MAYRKEGFSFLAKFLFPSRMKVVNFLVSTYQLCSGVLFMTIWKEKVLWCRKTEVAYQNL